MKLENMGDIKNAEVGTIIPVRVDFENATGDIEGVLLYKNGNSRLLLARQSSKESPLEVYFHHFIEDVNKEKGIQDGRFHYSVKYDNDTNVAALKTNQKGAQKKYLEAKRK